MSLNDFKQVNALGPDVLYALPQATSQTYAPLGTPAKKVVIESLALSRVPTAMRSMGWTTAAALMERWFEGPGWQMPEDWKTKETQPHPMSLSDLQCDEGIVKMEWAMGYQRCRDAVALAQSRLTTVAGVELLKEDLKYAGWKGEQPLSLGIYGMSAREMDATSQVNIAKFGDAWDALDDMYGALGKATVKMGVVGRAVRDNGSSTGVPRHLFHVEYLGFYIRDNYDFNGLQYLGTWTEDRVLTKAETLLTVTPEENWIVHLQEGPFAAVTNADFRTYRKKIGKGGDFVIYSDVLWKKVDQVIDLGGRV